MSPMQNIDKAALLSALSPPLDHVLCEQLLDEFISLERRYLLRDWEPATLDGGQFVEVAARIIYHRDSANLSRRRSVSRSLQYVENSSGGNQHLFPDRKSALHLVKVLRTIYKFRSDRGAVHIDPEYSANQMDAGLLLENARWVLSEILRVFWTGDLAAVARAIRQIVQYKLPVIGEYDSRLLVERTDCTGEEEIVLLLHHAGERGLSRTQLGKYVEKHESAVSRGIKKLCSTRVRQVVKLATGNYRLTNIGTRRVLTELADKLLM